MRLSDYDYELPEELIAQQPAARRDASRLLVVDRDRASWRDEQFSRLPSLLGPGDLLVRNNTRVFPARLTGERDPSGGRVELLLLERRADDALLWEALARPARRLQPGARLRFDADGRLRAEVVEVLDEGKRLVRFACAGDFAETLREIGEMPLPPYIRREGSRSFAEDRERYQTVYATQSGAIAAPTAGLHFTEEIFRELEARGVEIVEITLHVGYGTFEPVRTDDLSRHRVAPERGEISAAAAERINAARALGHRLIAVGTTTVRALESAADERGRVAAGPSTAGLTITPGYRFRVTDALVTNFHLPRSSLLILVAAFAGRDLTLAAYAHAVRARYRFYSYGDCMLII